ncbi:MAG: hypothetical protein KGL11_01885 [Alphaproteobacteria bacterium]|nr:hypothetical protein [Alphaproteobacteria bacterium]
MAGVPPAVASGASPVDSSIERGVAMARQSQWALALRYFHKAHAAAPDNAAALLNLGLANDRMGGHEAAAIAWFRAYAAAAPGAANIAKVRKRINELSVALEVNIQKLIDTDVRIANELTVQRQKTAALSALVRVYAELGDIANAKRMAETAGRGAEGGWNAAYLAAALARRGDFSEAAAESGRIASPTQLSWTQAEIAVEQARRKNFDAAAETAGQIRVKTEAAYAFSRLAVLRARAGDTAGAEALLAKIDESEAGARAVASAAVAAAMFHAGDASGGSRLLATASDALNHARTTDDRLSVQAMIAVAKAAQAPDLTPAAAAADIDGGAYRDRAIGDILVLRGDQRRARIFHWTSIAGTIENDTKLGGLHDVIEAAKSKAPSQSAADIAAAAYEAARAFSELRE